MHEDIGMYERVFAMEDYAIWSKRDQENPRATPYEVADWLMALDAAAGINDDDSAEQAKRLMELVGG